MIYLEQRRVIDSRLSELGYKQESTGNVSKSKAEVVREWFKQNPNKKRADFMLEFKDLGSKSMLSTYYQNHKPK